MVGGWRSRTRILCKRRNWKEELGEGAERRSWQVGVPAWGFSAKDDKQENTLRSRFGILSKRRKNNKTTILGHIIMAFQVGVPAWGFSAKEDKQQKTDSGAQSKQNKTTHRSAATGVLRKKRLWLQNGGRPAVASKANKESKTKKRTVLQPQAFCEQKTPVAAERLSFFLVIVEKPMMGGLRSRLGILSKTETIIKNM